MTNAGNPPATNAPPATLYQRYLAQCEADIGPLLAAVCTEAAAPPGDGGAWVAPVEQLARQVLPGLGPLWARQWALAPVAAATGFGASGSPSLGHLTLMSDDDVDEDIESTRVVQAIEGAAEWALRDLRSRLASGASGPYVAAEALGLAPSAIVAALCTTLREANHEAGLRLAVMRLLAPGLGRALAALYARHAEMLADWGLQPVRYAIRREPEARRSPSGGGAVGVGAAQIPALLAQVAGDAGLTHGMQALLGRLAGPVERSVAADGSLLDSVDNPLWRLIDRLAALGQLDGGGPAGPQGQPLHERLEPIIARLEQAAQPMPVERYAQALAEAEALSLAEPGRTGMAPATAGTPLSEGALQAQERRQTLEPVVRAQMVARLREGDVMPAVKQFLLGPWLGVVLKAVVDDGEEAASTRRVLAAVEALVEAGGHQRRAALTPAELTCLRLEAEDGLAASGMPVARVQQHVDDLAAALKTWPRRAPDTLPAPPDEDPGPAFDEDTPGWPTHADLPTVPIALDAQNPNDPARQACEAWLESLAEGDICRVQRQGQWATLRLTWRSDKGTFFAFGNQAGLAFCTSRRVLGRMRLEGLATTMARGEWVRHAADTLPMALE